MFGMLRELIAGSEMLMCDTFPEGCINATASDRLLTGSFQHTLLAAGGATARDVVTRVGMRLGRAACMA